MTESQIFLRHNLDVFSTLLAEVAPKQAEFAMMQTMNTAAYEGAQAVKQEISRVFDRPTNWVRGGVRYTKATRARLQCRIDLDFWGNKQGVTVDQVLKAEIHGGVRSLKRFEVALNRIGVLPAGMAVVPGSAAKLDQYGNMSVGQINQVLSWFQAFGQQGYSANMVDGGKRLGRDNKRTGARGYAYFALQKPYGKLPAGIYQRFTTGFGSSVKPIMVFIRRPAYKSKLNFYGIGYGKAMSIINRDLATNVAKAVETAR